jgi:threonine/homoserine/homoserine lactone efflux protein
VVIVLAQSFKKFLTDGKNARRLNFLSGSIFIAFGAKLATTKM